MSTMDELVAAISGDMHVSQDGYELKALQEYLAKTISVPTYPQPSPSAAFHNGFHPTSRSTSSTRKPPSYFPETYAQSAQPFPSPSASTSFFHSSDNLPLNAASGSRPAALRRTSSYGFGGGREHPITSATMGESSSGFGFEGDAFAPLSQPSSVPSTSNPWGQFTAPPPQEKANPWAGFAGQSKVFGYKQPTNFVQQQPLYAVPQQHATQSRSGHHGARDDDAMDEEMADECMDFMEEEERVERAMGFGAQQEGVINYDEAIGLWDRSRRNTD